MKTGSSLIVLFSFLLMQYQLIAQTIVGDESKFAVGGIVATNSALISTGSTSWGDESQLTLYTGAGLFGEINLANMKSLGNNEVVGFIRIANSLTLSGGIINVDPSAELLLEQGAAITSIEEGFVNGLLFHQGNGEKFFPIGKNGTYTPVKLIDVTGDPEVLVGIEAFNQDLGIFPPTGVESASPNWYWEISHSEGYEGSIITLPITEEDAANNDFTVLQSDDNSVVNLGGTLIDDLQHVSSMTLALGPYLLLGYGTTPEAFKLAVHNIVTPEREDGKNDALYIENIHRYPLNTVILMDRYGTEVCRIKNFTNDPSSQNACDLQKIAAGNYICAVEIDDLKFDPVLITILK